jgi:RHS repeat-associated protein
VRELLDTNRASFAFYAYDAFGNPVETTSAPTASISATMAARIAARQPLRYAAYAWDAASGLYYCSQRYYDPSVAAFISKDPARADGEESAYQYCGGDPIGKVDPSGEYPVRFAHHVLSDVRLDETVIRLNIWATLYEGGYSCHGVCHDPGRAERVVCAAVYARRLQGPARALTVRIGTREYGKYQARAQSGSKTPGKSNSRIVMLPRYSRYGTFERLSGLRVQWRAEGWFQPWKNVATFRYARR